MSTLDSTSTLAQIQAAYADNASYAEDGSATKAAAFETACRLLLVKLTTEAGRGTSRVRLDENLRQIRAELEAVRTWRATNTSVAAGGGVFHPDFSALRDY